SLTARPPPSTLFPYTTLFRSAEPIDHRGVRVGAHEGVGIGLRRAALGREHDPCQVFEVDLMHDAGIGRHDAESLERSLRPPQQRDRKSTRLNSSHVEISYAVF